MNHKSLNISHLPITGVNSVAEHAGWEDTLEYALEKIRTGLPKVVEAQEAIRACPDPDQRRKLKRDLLPAFALGSYTQEYVKGANCTQTPGMIIDIDHLPQEKFPATFEKICSIPEVYAAFRSPSGDGIKAVLLFDQPLEAIEKEGKNVLPQFYRDIYRFYAQKLFQLEELDSKTCNVDRLCYFAYDPTLYLNTNPKLLSFTEDTEALDLFIAPPIKPPAVARQLEARPTYRTADFLDPASLSDAIKERIISATPYLKDLDEPAWFRVALALKPYGQFGWETFLNLSVGGRHSDDEETIRAKFEAASDQFSGPRIGLGTFFFLAKKNGWKAPAANYLSSAPENFWAIRVKANKEGTKEEVIFPPYRVIRFLESQGFGLYNVQGNGGYEIIRLCDNIIRLSNITRVVEFLRRHIESSTTLDDKTKILDAFVAQSGYFGRTNSYINLPVVTPSFLRDTAEEAYVFFQNCWVKVTAPEIFVRPYAELPGHVHENMLRERTFEPTQTRSDFETFIENITTADTPEASRQRLDSLKTAIGYLIHGYKGVTQAVVLTDEKFTFDLEEANGGTGKSLIGQSLSYLRPMTMVDGKLWDGKSQFNYEEVTPETKIIHFNDLKANFNLDDIFVAITESLYVKIKNKTGFRVEDIKFILSTNYSIRGNGQSYERRQHIVELSSFYNAKHPPSADFSKHFFTDWNNEDWNAFFSFYLRCVQQFLQTGLSSPLLVNVARRRIQNDVGPFYFHQIDPYLIACLIYRSEDGLLVKSVFDEFKIKFPEDTRQLTSNAFSKKVNQLMKFYGVESRQFRKIVNGFKETFYTYTVTANTFQEVLDELKELKSHRQDSTDFGGIPHLNFFSDRRVA